MKRFALALIATILITGAMMAQTVTTNQGYVMGYVVPTSTTKTTGFIKKNSFVMIANDTTLYLCKINIGAGNTLAATMLASGSNYAIINRAVFGGKAITFFVDTANAQNVYGVKTFKNNALFGGTLGVTGNVAVNTNKFVVTAASGNTAVAGTLGVTGDVAVNTNKFTVASSSGNTVVAGTLNVTGQITPTTHILPASTETVNLGSSGKKFDLLYCNSVTTGSVNTNGSVINVSMLPGSAGGAYIGSDALPFMNVKAGAGYVDELHLKTPWTTTSDTTNAALGKIVYKTSDNHFYGCKNTGAGKKWYQLDN